MDAQEYFDIYLQMAQLDPEFENFTIETVQYEGETEEDAVTRWLGEQRVYLYNLDGQLTIDFDRAEEIHPTLAKVLRFRQQAYLNGAIDELIDAGIITQSVDESGEPVFGATEDYEEKVREYHRRKKND